QGQGKLYGPLSQTDSGQKIGLKSRGGIDTMKQKGKYIMTILLTFFVLAIGALLFIASQKPDDFKYERTAVINASPSALFPLINDLHQWERWSPWAEMDRDAKTDFSGSDKGVGASMAWNGNAKVGKGT